MGSSDKESGMLDCCVGAIVWVRRRNGSWWPGKILGAEELSDAHLMSPRSGTPVKLLGREDASVDWYNLEKSKRVKTFRCGEFDDCIERAESSLGMAPKKREKYARREDAILHALELEKEMLEKETGEFGCSSTGKSTKSFDAGKNELVTPLESSSYGNGKDVCPKLHSKKGDSSLEDKNIDSSVYAQKVEEGNQPAGNEVSSVIPRMRGLQDLGLRVASSKRRLSSSVALNDSRKPGNENIAHALPSDGHTENTADADSKSALGRRRTSREVMTNETVVGRRDRRRPLVQVLQSSAESPVHHSLQNDNDNISVPMLVEEETGSTHCPKRSRYLAAGESSECLENKQSSPSQMVMSPTPFEVNCPQPASLGEENNSESTENTETDSSETESLHSDADDKMVGLSDAAVFTELEPNSRGISGLPGQHGTMTEPYGLALASDMTNLCPAETISASVGVSKWQLKGKRNNRSLTKRSTDVTGRRGLRGSIAGLRGSVEGTNREAREIKGCGEPDLTENKFSTTMRSLDNLGLLTSKFTSKGLDDTTQKTLDWEHLAWNEQSVTKGYVGDSTSYFDPRFEGRPSFGGRRKSMLVDVDLKVQSSYQREHVPMISLMSKLNGKAIVGHPIQIEALENGSSDSLLSAVNSVCPESLDNDTSLPSMWKTARRTAKYRVPRSHPLAATLDGEETLKHYQYLDQDKNIKAEKSSLGSSRSRPKMDRKYTRRPSKKISLSSGQKIKTLSSIGVEQKLGSDSQQRNNNNHQFGALTKEGPVPTAVACIPVKLVFSRLYEELVCRPSIKG